VYPAPRGEVEGDDAVGRNDVDLPSGYLEEADSTSILEQTVLVPLLLPALRALYREMITNLLMSRDCLRLCGGPLLSQ
jgi:hypothetical protein